MEAIRRPQESRSQRAGAVDSGIAADEHHGADG
jgi:hypothetical protein